MKKTYHIETIFEKSSNLDIILNENVEDNYYAKEVK